MHESCACLLRPGLTRYLLVIAVRAGNRDVLTAGDYGGSDLMAGADSMDDDDDDDDDGADDDDDDDDDDRAAAPGVDRRLTLDNIGCVVPVASSATALPPWM